MSQATAHLQANARDTGLVLREAAATPNLVKAGLVSMPQWRNPDDPLVAAVLAGVGRKPG